MSDAEQDPRRVGRDEMNLAEYPITLLAERVPPGLKTIAFKDRHGTLTVSGSDAYGLPAAPDADVIVALLHLVLELSNGRKGTKIALPIPEKLRDCLRFLEVRLVYDKKDRRYFWHIVVENGIRPKPSPGDNVVSVDLGEIHPAVVGDKEQAIVITCRERRSGARAGQAAGQARQGNRPQDQEVPATPASRARQVADEGQARSGPAGHRAQGQPRDCRVRGAAPRRGRSSSATCGTSPTASNKDTERLHRPHGAVQPVRGPEAARLARQGAALP